MEDGLVQRLFIEMLTIGFALVSGFAMIYRTWIKPFSERLADYDRRLIQMEERIGQNTKAIDEHEDECQNRMANVYTKFDEVKASINELAVEIAKKG